jgi:molybdopterin-guanine dinucleotide biosynthesis protein A
MTGIILAGGRNTRIGTNKALLKVDGGTIIENTAAVLSPLFESLIVVTNSPDSYEFLGLNTVPDLEPGKGPLVGIYSGLLASSDKWNFVVGCDMPFLSPELIAFMSKFCDASDVVVPRLDSYYESLHAFYNKSCLDSMKEQIESGNLKINSLFATLRLHEVTREEIERFGDTHTLFFNVNTLSDLEFARSMKAPKDSPQ